MFHKILKDLRVLNKYTQQELADKLDVSQRTIAFYEKGDRHPDYETLIKISKIFDVSVDYLLGLENENLEKVKYDEYGIVVTKAKNTNISAKALEEMIDFINKQKKD